MYFKKISLIIFGHLKLLSYLQLRKEARKIMILLPKRSLVISVAIRNVHFCATIVKRYYDETIFEGPFVYPILQL